MVDGVVSPVLITAGPPSVAHVLFPQPGATVTVIDDRAGNWKRHYRLVQVTLESGPGLGQTGTMERQYPRLAQ